MGLIKLNYACFLNQSGYSQAAQNYIMALHKTGECDIKVTIFGGKPSKPAVSDEKYEFFMEMVKKEEDPERILIYHCIPNIQKRVKKPQHSIGFATFETFQPPESWVGVLNTNDAIIAPSQFNHKIFSHMDIKKPLYYIPHCLDADIYNKNVKPMFDFDKYTFLFMGIWRERKGYKQLFEAWLKEFTENDNVQLLVKTDRPKRAEEYLKQIMQQLGINKGNAPVIFENKVFDERELPNFIKSVDCLVAPTMGEGFGYPGLQCMAMGVPVIITDHSGCQDYANSNTATLLDVNGFVAYSNMDNIPQFRNKKWAFIEVSKIRKAMRFVKKNKDEVRMKASVAHHYVSNRFNYREVGRLFINMLRELYD
jgi:glycosyltransferase involved in cell wall biosynthesis